MRTADLNYPRVLATKPFKKALAFTQGGKRAFAALNTNDRDADKAATHRSGMKGTIQPKS